MQAGGGGTSLSLSHLTQEQVKFLSFSQTLCLSLSYTHSLSLSHFVHDTNINAENFFSLQIINQKG